MRCGAWRSRAERGQMAVELAVVLPVCIVVGLVAYNLCRFVEACATFDRVAPDAVIALGVSPAGEQSALSAAGQVRSSIQSALDMSSCEVSVQVSGAQQDGAAGHGLGFSVSPLLTTFTCTLRYRPWPGSFVMAGVVFTPPIALTHTRTLVVDRFRPGVVV